MPYYTILTEKDKLVDGLNVWKGTFDPDPKSYNVKAGFYVMKAEDILHHVAFGSQVVEVSLPTESKVVEVMGMYTTPVYRTDMIILGKRHNPRQLDEFKALVETGRLNTQNHKNVLISWSVHGGHLDILVYLIKEHNFTDMNRMLRSASDAGQLEIVKYLVANGADIHHDNQSPLRIAKHMGRVEVVEYLTSLN